jgi:hypothetical protein
MVCVALAEQNKIMDTVVTLMYDGCRNLSNNRITGNIPLSWGKMESRNIDSV